MNNDEMKAALAKALVSIAELQAAWTQQLPRERLDQLKGLTDKGMSIGFIFVGGAKQYAKIAAVDPAGGFVTLVDIELTTLPRH